MVVKLMEALPQSLMVPVEGADFVFETRCVRGVAAQTFSC
jgi:hypothetical protein